MAIKTEIGKASNDNPFPCLMKTKVGNLVVLFTSEQEGVVLSSGSSYWDLGYYAEDWVSALDKEYWEPSPPVTLSNM